MRFSVLVPVYNTRAYLADCVDSVLRQSFSDFELVLLDDGSTDGSGALCDALCRRDARVRAVHTENRGLLAARRRAIAEAKGEICVSLDSDDLLAPHALLTLDARMHAPEAPDLVIFNFACFTDPAGPYETEPPVFSDGRVFSGEAGKAPVYEELVSDWRLNNFVTKAICTPLLRADTTDYAPYFSCAHSEDLLQSLEPVTQAKAIAYCAEPLYLYRRNEASITRRRAICAADMEKQFNRPVMERLRGYLPRWGMDTPLWQERFAARELTGLVSVFWQAYRGAKTQAERRTISDFDWAGAAGSEALRFRQSPYLKRSDALTLRLLLKKRGCILYLLGRLSALRRALRGKGR